MARESYNTKTKGIINDAIKCFPNGFTIKELKEYLDNNNQQIGLTTIYRLLDRLEEEGIAKKYFDENNITHYKYVNDCISDRHFYLKCVKCDKIIHVDCDCLNELSVHILKQHKFSIDTRNIILSGICNDCKNFIKI